MSFISLAPFSNVYAPTGLISCGKLAGCLKIPIIFCNKSFCKTPLGCINLSFSSPNSINLLRNLISASSIASVSLAFNALSNNLISCFIFEVAIKGIKDLYALGSLSRKIAIPSKVAGTLDNKSISPFSFISTLGKYNVNLSISKSAPDLATISFGTIILLPASGGKKSLTIIYSIEFNPSVGIRNPTPSKASLLILVPGCILIPSSCLILCGKYTCIPIVGALAKISARCALFLPFNCEGFTSFV